jgi:hypothetical protein
VIRRKMVDREYEDVTGSQFLLRCRSLLGLIKEVAIDETLSGTKKVYREREMEERK